ncbi:hypothetical protein [Streptomyces sp. D54]|uniref:hypothetical protein n=1 Tax=Streptomyces sp. D54 TaxID=1290289 RepID=UPI003CF10136
MNAPEAPEPATARTDPYEVDDEVQHALDRLTLLISAAEALAGTLDMDTGIRHLCRTLVPSLADWCAVDLLEDGKLRRVAVDHRKPEGALPGLTAAALAREPLGVCDELLTGLADEGADDIAVIAVRTGVAEAGAPS